MHQSAQHTTLSHAHIADERHIPATATLAILSVIEQSIAAQMLQPVVVYLYGSQGTI